jgi:hypothetical protein
MRRNKGPEERESKGVCLKGIEGGNELPTLTHGLGV